MPWIKVRITIQDAEYNYQSEVSAAQEFSIEMPDQFDNLLDPFAQFVKAHAGIVAQAYRDNLAKHEAGEDEEGDE